VGAIDGWNGVLARSSGASLRELCESMASRMRERHLTFGGRLLCPFLRPFFLSTADEARVKDAAERLWAIGERVVQAALAKPSLLDDLALSEDERALARIDPGYATTSTAARADAFLLPKTLQFAEYNAESPAGPGYSQRLAEVFDATPVMDTFRGEVGTGVRMYRPIAQLLDALVASYREWGGRASPPTVAIVDWREVPTFSEFELLRDAFLAAGVPTVICDPRDLELRGEALYGGGRRIDLVYRRVLINDIVARRGECAALLAAYERRAVCVANSLRCKISHKKAFFAVLTDERHAALFDAPARDLIHRHVPWTALVREGRTRRDGRDVDLLPHLRRERERFVVKPNDEYGGTGVTLGWEASESEWDRVLARALAERDRGWVAQERIEVRREPYPVCTESGIETRDMLVDFAPYVFRGKLAGFLTRLSATGLANVTSGGGQVPAFVVDEYN
jgi:uncharacterized circularly permuted ATP-grasp superfamily protein